MLQPELVARLKARLPESLHERAIVAGGYAAHPQKALDVDLWVVGVPLEDFTKVERTIRKHLSNHGYLSEGAPADQESLRDLQREFQGEALHYEEHPGQFRVVVEGVPAIHGLPLQIIISAQPFFDALLHTFDITTHQIGYPLLAPTEVMVTDDYTFSWEQPRVTNFDRPHQTLRRLERIAPRYGFEPHPEDVAKLLVAKDDTNWQEAA